MSQTPPQARVDLASGCLTIEDGALDVKSHWDELMGFLAHPEAAAMQSPMMRA